MKKLDGYLAAEASSPEAVSSLTKLEGEGTVEITATGARWRNAGNGVMTLLGSKRSFPLSWDETFSGKRPSAARAAAGSSGTAAAVNVEKTAKDIMTERWDSARVAFEDAGGTVWAKPATGRIQGVNAATGERLEMAGNLKEGVTTRRTSTGGEVWETKIAPDGKITTLHDFTVDASNAAKYKVAPGTRLTELSSGNMTAIQPGRPLAQATPVIVLNSAPSSP